MHWYFSLNWETKKQSCTNNDNGQRIDLRRRKKGDYDDYDNYDVYNKSDYSITGENIKNIGQQ